MGDFCVFILTHGRANAVVTDATLRRSGYTGQVRYLVDDEDSQLEEYMRRFGDSVVVFNKETYVRNSDSGNNFGRRGSILFARNASFDAARQLGVSHFWQLDDDYTCFAWACGSDRKPSTHARVIRRLDDVVRACVSFLDASGAMTVAFAQGGDFAGGAAGDYARYAAQQTFTRKAMNSFICATERPIRFRGVFNEDVSTYVESGRQGNLFITIPRLRITQKATQSQAGGITELYVDCGTYVKAFSTVMYAPSCVRVRSMGNKFRRVHHAVRWGNACPLIVGGRHKKTG